MTFTKFGLDDVSGILLNHLVAALSSNLLASWSFVINRITLL